MQIHRNLSTFPSTLSPVVTVGMFDGVHLGHRKILDRLVSLARERSTRSVVVTFEPHPKLVLGTANEEFNLLTTLEEKIRLIENTGVEHLVVLPFTPELSGLSPEAFVVGVLVNALNADYIVMGPDHQFGKGREGGIEVLSDLSEQYHFTVEKLTSQDIEDSKVSSTRIRKALAGGDLDRAWLFLGYPYLMSGQVVEGDRKGRTIGFPTINLETHPNKLIPGNGVYAVYAEYQNEAFDGMCNIGFRPTLDGKKLTIETNIFDFDKDIYGEQVTIGFMEKIRSEKKFENLDALAAQLRSDKEKALQILRR